MEAWIWSRMVRAVAFLCLTYVPLQVAAIWRQRGAGRISAALPMIVMVPVILGAFRPAAYRDGSLFGMYFVCPYLPVMLYLAGLAIFGFTGCPHCGKTVPRSSFASRPKICPHCGEDRLAKPNADSDLAE